MTIENDSAMIKKSTDSTYCLIEVADFISNLLDVEGTVEERRKESSPKGYIPVSVFLGHEVKNLMTVIAIDTGIKLYVGNFGWGAINFCKSCRLQQKEMIPAHQR